MTTTETNRKPVVVRCRACSTMNRVDLTRSADGPKCSKCATALSLGTPQPVTDADLQRIIDSSSVPVLVDFYADWCGPCKMMAPAVDQLALRHQGKVLVAKLDTDRSQVTAQTFGIRGIPTVIVFRDGKEARRQAGAVPYAVLEGMVG